MRRQAPEDALRPRASLSLDVALYYLATVFGVLVGLFEAAARYFFQLPPPLSPERSSLLTAALHTEETNQAVRFGRGRGLFLQFGVGSGESLKIIASLLPSGSTVHGFDKRGGEELPLPAFNARFHRGEFEASLPAFLTNEASVGEVALPFHLPLAPHLRLRCRFGLHRPPYTRTLDRVWYGRGACRVPQQGMGRVLRRAYRV